MTTATIGDRVKRGAAFLDQALPGWDERINVSTLDLASGCDCVLGQLYGTFNNGVRSLHLRRRDPETPWIEATQADDMGFFVLPTVRGQILGSLLYDFELRLEMTKYRLLTAAWAELITDRRAERQLAELETAQTELVSV